MASLEFSLLAVSILACLMLVSFAGKAFEVAGNVSDAAAQAARSASLARSFESAKEAATDTASTYLLEVCESFSVATTSDDFEPGGFVGVSIDCQVSLAGISLLKIPTKLSFQSSSVEVIDRYRT